MKVCVIEYDSEFLKVLLASKISSTPIEVEKLDEEPRDSKIPFLDLGSKGIIETGNEICSFLLPPPASESTIVNNWLRWDSYDLSSIVSSAKNVSMSDSELKPLLERLNSSLSDNYLCGALSAADVCVWCTLYPLYSDGSCTSLFEDYNNLRKWLDRLSDEFKVGQLGYEIKHGLSAIPKLPSEDNIDALIKSRSDEAVKLWESAGVDAHPKAVPRVHPILPQKGQKNILITAALPYVNNVPHLGNIIGCVLSADVFARYCRLRNWNVLYIGGTDEYGTATETKALEEGLTPQEICEKYFAVHSEIYSMFNIEFDQFGRTTTNNQKEIVQEMFKNCHANGFTLTEVVDQLLCEKCDRYLADRFVEGTCPKCKYEDARGDQCDGCGNLINAIELIDPRCKVCRSTPVVKQSNQLFLDLPKIEPMLAEWINSASSGWTHNAKVITKAWLREGLRPRCITRDLKWGIPVPLEGFESKVFYVWFDAPIGYMSITKTYSEEWKQWWEPDSKVSLYQFLAKDNVPFHSIMFPATIISCRPDRQFKLVDHLMAVEYLNYEDGKFSKSRGIGVFGNDAKDTGIPLDVFRFYLLYIRPESQDSNFSWADMAVKNNTDLLNNLGNFILRTLTFCTKFFDSKVPKLTLTDEEKALIGVITMEISLYQQVIEKGRLKEGIKYILNVSRHGNQYIQSNQPWVLVKGDESERERAATVVAFACNMVGLLAIILQPYMPASSEKIRQETNFPSERFALGEKFLPIFSPGHEIGKPTPLFTKIEQATVDTLKAKYAGKQKAPEPTLDVSGLSIADLDEEIAKQGEKVRQLKASGAEKNVIQAEVNLLLELKKKLALAKGEPVPTGSKDKKKKK